MKVKELIKILQQWNPNNKVSIYLRDDVIPLDKENGYQLWSPKVTFRDGWPGLTTIELDEFEGGDIE